MRREWFSTLCTVAKGKLKLFDRLDFDRALARFGEGEELELIIQTLERQRTGRQNRFFHGPVCTAFMELGYNQVEAKYLLCWMFLPVEIQLPDESWIRVPGHTSALSVEEFNAFLTSCIQYAAEQNIVIKDSETWLAEQLELEDRARKQALQGGKEPALSLASPASLPGDLGRARE